MAGKGQFIENDMVIGSGRPREHHKGPSGHVTPVPGEAIWVIFDASFPVKRPH